MRALLRAAGLLAGAAGLGLLLFGELYLSVCSWALAYGFAVADGQLS